MCYFLSVYIYMCVLQCRRRTTRTKKGLVDKKKKNARKTYTKYIKRSIRVRRL